MENSAQATLLKIDFEIDPEIEITKKIILKNSSLESLKPKKRHEFFFRFTFHTTFQYLNEKEEEIKDIYVFDGEVIEGNLDNYSLQEGKEEEIRIPDIKEPYFLARDNLKKQLQDKTDLIIMDLNNRLELETQRIEEHFLRETRESDENLEEALKKLMELVEEGDMDKISHQKKIIDSFKQKTNFEELKKDKNRALLLEKQKHILDVNNKLLDTTLIYYPLFTFDACLKSVHTKRIVEISFDPMKKIMSPLLCETCNKDLKEIFLCSTGHISCKDCILSCESCQKQSCKRCIKINCEHCKKDICHDCSIRCFRCSKNVCKTHTKIDKVSGKIYCNKCLKRCERCSNLKDPYSFKVSKKTNAEICEECFRDEMQKGVLEGVFE